MQRRTHEITASTREFMTYGTIGLELGRARERHAQDWASAAQLDPIRSLATGRRRLGAWLIGLGELVAGAPAAAAATR